MKSDSILLYELELCNTAYIICFSFFVFVSRLLLRLKFFWQQVGSSSPKSIQLINQIKLNKQISDYYFRGLYALHFSLCLMI